MSSLPRTHSWHLFSFDEIKLATQNFSPDLVVGEGGFGKVYRAIIAKHGEPFIVAVKRLNRGSEQGATEFCAEVEMLTKLRHCNIVSLIGYCNDNSELILVYEFMSNGTLYDHLHRHGANLSWLQLLDISVGAARGLQYLHTGAGIKHGVIHRDVKSKNILLDDDYAAKISDFGLSKVCKTDVPNTHVDTRVMGSDGYVDPEYMTSYRLTMKSDVYSFGVVLCELLCRKEAFHRSLHKDGCHLAKWVGRYIKKGKVHKIIDPKIKNQISPKCLREFVRIANRCLHPESAKRPSMAEVVTALELSVALQYKFDTSVKAASGTSRLFAIGRMFKRPFITPEVNSEDGGGESDKIELPACKEYMLGQLRAATDGFSVENIVSGHDKEAPNIVYKGKIGNGDQLIAVKRFNTSAWPDARQFSDEAKAVGKLRNQSLVNLLGYCVDKNERLLVAEFMSHETLFKHLFESESQPLKWAMRLRVALCLAQALDYCCSNGRLLYYHLNPHRILFDLGTPKLSCFGLINHSQDGKIDKNYNGSNPPEYSTTGRVTAEGVIYSCGTIFLSLLSGGHIDPLQVLRSIKEKSFQMDRCLEGNISNDDAVELSRIALRCVHRNPKERPNFISVVAALTALQKQTDDTIPNLSPLGVACSSMDLYAIHKILKDIGYSGDEVVIDEYAFAMWTREIQDALNAKKNADKAFQAKDFTTAVECYASLIKNEARRISSPSFFPIVTPTTYVRRCLSHLMIGKAQEALEDVMQVHMNNSRWSVALYLQVAALLSLGMDKAAHEMLEGAVSLDLETTPATQISNLSPLRDACVRMDLTAIHQILEKIGYSGDDGVTDEELSLQLWTGQLHDTLNIKKHGDSAFQDKDFATAIECYTNFIESGMMVSPTMYVRRCLSYMMINMAQEALGDALHAEMVYPDWSLALYLHAATLFSLGLEKEAHEILEDAVLLDSKRGGN